MFQLAKRRCVLYASMFSPVNPSMVAVSGVRGTQLLDIRYPQPVRYDLFILIYKWLKRLSKFVYILNNSDVFIRWSTLFVHSATYSTIKEPASSEKKKITLLSFVTFPPSSDPMKWARFILQQKDFPLLVQEIRAVLREKTTN